MQRRVRGYLKHQHRRHPGDRYPLAASKHPGAAQAERDISEAVAVARAEGHSWAAIGAMLGTSGEAARQRYGHLART
jgi:hypothetical protein